MLLGQQFGGGHDGGLAAAGDGRQCRHRRHHGLARTDVALDQTQHWRGPGQVGSDLVEHATLGAGQRKRQLGQKASLQAATAGQLRRAVRLNAQAHLAQAQLVGQQLFHSQSPGGRVMPVA